MSRVESAVVMHIWVQTFKGSSALRHTLRKSLLWQLLEKLKYLNLWVDVHWKWILSCRPFSSAIQALAFCFVFGKENSSGRKNIDWQFLLRYTLSLCRNTQHRLPKCSAIMVWWILWCATQAPKFPIYDEGWWLTSSLPGNCLPQKGVALSKIMPLPQG